ncbi:MAG: TonB-dependent receptor [Saprospiraceae bacterium]|nr:TonB-dependent receptor [Saprospiraceae bacterium]
MKQIKHIIPIIVLSCVISNISAQFNDTLLTTEISEMVVTATRTDRHLSNVAVPALIVQSRAIQLSGSLRLNEILQEQTGLFLTSGAGSSSVGGGVFGNGIQIQGLSPDYTLMMIDGEPLIGRQGGVIDLSRYTVGNIRKIEIIKGPSSALYGSEAMGGVVNILTEIRRSDYINGGIRYGSFQTKDVFSSANINHKKSSLYLFGNYNASAGYDLNTSSIEKTTDPYQNATAQLKWTYRFSDKTRLTWNNRFYYGFQNSEFAINSESINIKGEGKTLDINVNPTITHIFNEKVKSSIRMYSSIYRYDQNLDEINTSEKYYLDNFQHEFYRIENQTDLNLSDNHAVVVGGGYNLQAVETMRYRDRKTQHISYFFLQDEWRAGNKWVIIPGIRFDANSDYANRLTPKLSAQFQPAKNWQINFSYGSGFKAPDFRQLYLYYVNVAAQGYRIYGASEFSIDELVRQQESGLIDRILPEAYNIKELTPEISHGFNLGAGHQFRNIPVKADINLFYNSISDLINYVPVAVQQNAALIFSYLNVKRAYTAGMELNMNAKISNHFDVGFGYQYLMTGDRDIIAKIDRGEVYGRKSPLGSTKLMTASDYNGLLGRSPHMINFKVLYDHPETGWGGSLRAIYRSKWGVADLDGNGFANMPEEFANGFCMLNSAVQKTFQKKYTFQVSANNLLNHIDEVNVPQMPGTHLMFSLQWNFSN